MLKIFNKLVPFFEDNYRRINVREYSRLLKISPPSASKILNELREEGLLIKEEEKNYLYFYANKENFLFINLQIIYYREKFNKIGLFDALEKDFINPVVILFGSFAKAEVNENSDIDLAIFSLTKKEINLKKYEEKLKRKIQVFSFNQKEDVKNEMLLNNILNGFKILGDW
ncbi:MAG: nucleotidyltransferase domain-containing protein [Nanoarchaeota archaeon]|nr:nucleotidyltransferase domain-containing protein [Nanoarchaeota archaeon]